MNSENRRTLEEQLKNCPFCGAKARLEPNSRAFVDGISTRVAFVRCSRCFARTGKYGIRGKFTPAEARKLAMDAWNYRFGEEN